VVIHEHHHAAVAQGDTDGVSGQAAMSAPLRPVTPSTLPRTPEEPRTGRIRVSHGAKGLTVKIHRISPQRDTAKRNPQPLPRKAPS
jgi:hypothetical protein